MSRSLVFLREAVPADAALLADLWLEVLRRGDEADHVADLARIVETAAEDPEQRLVVAEYDGRLAGGVHLRLTTVTPLNLDLSVQVMSPQVFPEFRRHGVGRALMDAAVSWAEERGRRSPRDRGAVRLAGRQPLHGPPRARPDRHPAPGPDHRRARQADGPAAAGRPGPRPAPHPRARRTPLDAPPGRRAAVGEIGAAWSRHGPSAPTTHRFTGPDRWPRRAGRAEPGDCAIARRSGSRSAVIRTTRPRRTSTRARHHRGPRAATAPRCRAASRG